MPYLICADCRLTTYSAALWADTEECPRCGAPVPVGEQPDRPSGETGARIYRFPRPPADRDDG